MRLSAAISGSAVTALAADANAPASVVEVIAAAMARAIFLIRPPLQKARPSYPRLAPPGILAAAGRAFPALSASRSEERRVGKSVDLGGRRLIKKKKRA